MQHGQFISIEGSEGAGKSTALQFIRVYLPRIKPDINIIWTREPGGSALAEEIRQVLLRPMSTESMHAETELLLMFAARIQHMQTCIIPALNAGKWVVSDRFIDATYAYQGGGRGINMSRIEMLDQWIVANWQPNLTLLLDVDPLKGLQRMAKRSTDKDRIEQEKIDFFVRVCNGYLKRAKQYPQRIQIIDANLPLATVEQQIAKVLDAFIVGK